MGTIGFILTAIVVFVIIMGAKGIRIVPQAHTMIIERLGRYHETLVSGINFIIPIIDKPRDMDWKATRKTFDGRSIIENRKITLIDLREAVYDFPRQNVITKDNVLIEIDAIIYYQITNAMKSVYEIQNLPDAIEKLTKTTLRNIIGEMDLDETLSSRDKINHRLRDILDEATDKWGVKVNRVEIQDIQPPHDIREAMEKQMRAERDRRAIILTADGEKSSRILESEGYRQKEINQADGDKQARILKAEGEAQAKIRIAEAEAQALKLVADALKATKMDAGSYLVALKYIEAFRNIAENQKDKVVFMPYEATGVLSSIGSIKEIFNAQK